MADDLTKVGVKPKGRHPEKRLTAPAVRSLGPGRHADGNGLYLEVDDTGARRWLLRTLVHGRRRDLGLGGASVVSLAEARELAAQLRKVALQKLSIPLVCAMPFTYSLMSRWRSQSRTRPGQANVPHVRRGGPPSPRRADRAERQERKAPGPVALHTPGLRVPDHIGSKPIHSVEQSDVLRVLAPIWTEKAETARRIKQRLRTVLDWARAAGHREGINPVEGVEKGPARQRDRPKHFAALPWQELPGLMPRLVACRGMGALALRFTILTAARSGGSGSDVA